METFFQHKIFYLYSIPMIISMIWVIYITIKDYNYDVKCRSGLFSGLYYIPTLTVGVIVGRLILALTPLVNAFYSFYVILTLVASAAGYMFELLKYPLVPKKEN